jgi:D-alanyl-D-alanine dipeptidase
MKKKLAEIFDAPINGPNSENITTDYFDIPIDASSSAYKEPLVNIPPELVAPESGGLSRANADTRTKCVWARRSIVPMLALANRIVMELTEDNPDDLGGRMKICAEEIYRPIENQRVIWDEEFSIQLKNAGGDMAEAERLTKILVSDPRRFDENNPRAWPIHSTGAAVDVCLSGDSGAARIMIDDDNGGVILSATDYYDRKAAAGERLSDDEMACLRGRRLLHYAMTAAGFENYPREAWHYDYKDQMWAMLRRLKGDSNAVAEYGYMANPEK